MKRKLIIGLKLASMLMAPLLAVNGCQVTPQRDASVATDPDVVAVDEPDYIIDVGYPPGCYYEGEQIVWLGHRYDKTVFRETVVENNIRNNRYMNVTVNRMVIERRRTVPRERPAPPHSALLPPAPRPRPLPAYKPEPPTPVYEPYHPRTGRLY